jgi:hypothetical protein
MNQVFSFYWLKSIARHQNLLSSPVACGEEKKKKREVTDFFTGW